MNSTGGGGGVAGGFSLKPLESKTLAAIERMRVPP